MSHISERSAVDISVNRAGPEKLGMVEGIETFEPDLQHPHFRELRNLVKGYIVVVHTWSVERPPRRVTRRPQSVGTVEGRVEVRLSVPRVPINLEIAGNDIRQIDADSIDTVVLDTDQRVVPKAGECDR